MQIPITVVSDCRDDNAKNRVLVRTASLFPGAAIHFIGVSDDLDAGGNLLDILDALDGRTGLILVNAAPRGGEHGTRWRNGSDFGAVTLGGTTVITTVSGFTLSFAKKLGLLKDDQVRVFDLSEVLASGTKQKRFGPEAVERITRTQFRSYEFAPRLGQWLLDGNHLPFSPLREPIPNLPQKVWWIDNFGNVKTSALPADVGWQPGTTLKTRLGLIPCYGRLSEVHDDEAAFVIGSSGFGNQRFVELVVRRGDAAHRFGLRVGSDIF